jgi:hypothetical protein
MEWKELFRQLKDLLLEGIKLTVFFLIERKLDKNKIAELDVCLSQLESLHKRMGGAVAQGKSDWTNLV